MILRIARFFIRRFSLFGCANRLEFLLCFLLWFGVSQLFVLTKGIHDMWLIVTLLVLFLLTALALLATAVRRQHDIGESALWLLCAFIPLLNILLTIKLFARPTKKGPNKYDPSRWEQRVGEIF